MEEPNDTRDQMDGMIKAQKTLCRGKQSPLRSICVVATSCCIDCGTGCAAVVDRKENAESEKAGRQTLRRFFSSDCGYHQVESTRILSTSLPCQFMLKEVKTPSPAPSSGALLLCHALSGLLACSTGPCQHWKDQQIKNTERVNRTTAGICSIQHSFGVSIAYAINT